MDELDLCFERYDEWYQIEPRLADYEALALGIIKKAGYTRKEIQKAVAESSQTLTDTLKAAHEIFYYTSAVRDTIKNGKRENIALEMMRLCNKAAMLNFCIIDPVLKKGQRFIDGPKKKDRKDQLSKKMWDNILIYNSEFSRLPMARELIDMVKEWDGIQEIDEENTIFWRRSDGAEKKTSFGSFQDRYTKLRKKFKKIQF